VRNWRKGKEGEDGEQERERYHHGCEAEVSPLLPPTQNNQGGNRKEGHSDSVGTAHLS
jgi:hypothetical protein